VLTLQGNYGEALDVFEAAISRMEYGSGAIAQYIAVLGKSQVLLRTGQLGEVLRISRSERKLAEKNGSAPWLFDFREAWVRTLVFDFTGALQICQSIGEPTAAYLAGQLQTITRIAEGSLDLNRGEYDRAIERFRQVRDREITPKFLLSWIWRLTAQLLTGDAWLLSGNILQARTEADSCLESALSTADPHLQALAWDLQARVAMAENDWAGARESIQQALAIVDRFEILVAAWQTLATAWQFYQHVKERDAAETNRERAEACILKIANSFEPDEPLRATFLAAATVRRMLRGRNANKSTRPHESRRGAAS
jgi:tetratricopeptide (TPR) repeat protein